MNPSSRSLGDEAGVAISDDTVQNINRRAENGAENESGAGSRGSSQKNILSCARANSQNFGEISAGCGRGKSKRMSNPARRARLSARLMPRDVASQISTFNFQLDSVFSSISITSVYNFKRLGRLLSSPQLFVQKGYPYSTTIWLLTNPTSWHFCQCQLRHLMSLVLVVGRSSLLY